MCEDCGWQESLEEIEEMTDSGDFSFAEDTLIRIAEWVDSNKHITARQLQAVSNIGDCKRGAER